MASPSQLLVTRWDDRAIVAGYVHAIVENGDKTEVTITNDLPLSADGVRRSGMITVVFKSSTVEKMKLKIGFGVVCTVKDQQIFDVLLNGDICCHPYFKTDGYMLRYTGDLCYHPELKRKQHVVIGNVLTTYEGVSQQGYRWAKYVVQFKSGGEQKTWNVMEYKTLHDVKKGRRYIFVAGHITTDRYDKRCSVVASQIFNF